jgi:hypothetical protein
VSVELPTMRGDKFSCQATQLIEAATRLSGWDLREYVRDYFEGDRGLGELSRILLLRIHNRIRWGLGWPPYRNVTGKQTKTPTAELRLQPGELVRVKDRAEIEATLDRLGRNRGLAFAAEMVRYCGGKYRVARRVERMIIEWTGELREMPNTVALEGVTCSGIAQQGCPRACFHLWREIWLRRAE